MPLQKIFNVIVDSDIMIPELPLLTEGAPDIRILSGLAAGLDIVGAKFLHEWKNEDGEVTIVCGRHGDDYVLSFTDGGDFLLSPGNGTIHYFAHPNIPIVTIRHMLLDQVLPRLLAQYGHFILHASAIQLPDGRGIVFSGPSGAGKSTLAASFFKQGAHLVTDDCLLLSVSEINVIGIASYRGLRLYEDSRLVTVGAAAESVDVAHYSAKSRVQFGQDEADADTRHVPIGAIFILQEGEEDSISISRAKSAQTAMDLVSQLFVLDVTDPNTAMRNLRIVTQLINDELPLFHIDYPRNYSYLDRLRKSVLEAIDEI